MTGFRSYAKINLHLQVCGRRPDGYHELRTVFQTIDLHDELEVDLAGRGIELEILEGEAPAGAENLVVRAAVSYAERWPLPGVRIGLRKRVPIGGGLGGGSSNAATSLLALRHLTGEPEDVADLRPIARALGADVPYFLVGGTALGFGRGDEIVPLPELPPTELVLVTPDVHVSTAEVFGGLEVTGDSELPASIAELLISGGPTTWDSVAGWNDLQAPVLRRFPLIQRACDNFPGSGSMGVRLSGSGSTLFCRAPGGWEYTGEEGLRAVGCRTVSREGIARTFIIGGPTP